MEGYDATNTAFLVGAQSKGDAAIFNEENRTVTFNNLTAALRVMSQDIKNDFSTFEFKIFSESIKDGVSIPGKTLWNAKATIINGQLLLEGDFQQNEFENLSKNNDANYTLKKTSKVVHISEDVDFNSLVIEMSGDDGNLASGIASKFAPNLSSDEGQKIVSSMKSDVNFNFDVLNKNKEIEINLTKNDLNKQIVNIDIVTFDGAVVKNINLPTSLNTPQKVCLTDFNSGAYYVRYLIDGNYYMKKFIL